MRVEVQCYSERAADERPVHFRFDDYEFLVEEMLEDWRGPDHQFFKVRAEVALPSQRPRSTGREL